MSVFFEVLTRVNTEKLPKVGLRFKTPKTLSQFVINDTNSHSVKLDYESCELYLGVQIIRESYEQFLLSDNFCFRNSKFRIFSLKNFTS